MASPYDYQQARVPKDVTEERIQQMYRFAT
jgi:hypothetical protein